jgi:hypothetical protein
MGDQKAVNLSDELFHLIPTNDAVRQLAERLLQSARTSPWRYVYTAQVPCGCVRGALERFAHQARAIGLTKLADDVDALVVVWRVWTVAGGTDEDRAVYEHWITVSCRLRLLTHAHARSGDPDR